MYQNQKMDSPQNDVRFPVGAGDLYPIDRSELYDQIKIEFENSSPYLSDNYDVKAMILPGVGYKYALKPLTYGYGKIEPQSIDEVFIFADPVLHQIDMLAFNSCRYWETPLGKVELSHRMDQIVHGDDRNKDLMKYSDQMFEGEVSIELQLPFLQYLLKDQFRLIPVMMGGVSPRISLSLFEAHIDPDDLIVVVSNLSEGLPLEYAKDVDEKSLEIIEKLDVDAFEESNLMLSSPTSVLMILLMAIKNGWRVKKLYHDHIRKGDGSRDSNIGIATLLFIGD